MSNVNYRNCIIAYSSPDFNKIILIDILQFSMFDQTVCLKYNACKFIQDSRCLDPWCMCQ